METVEFDEFGMVYIRPTHYAGLGFTGQGSTPTKINKNTLFCVICEKKLSMYNTHKDNVCYSDSCEKKFQESKKNKKNT